MARKRLNKNVVVALTLAMFGMIVVLSAIMLRTLQQQDPKYFLAHASRYEADEDWKQAALFYRKAYGRSEDPRHLVAFGRMMLNAGAVRSAVGAWQKALIQDPKLVDAHEQLLAVLLELARLDGRITSWSAVRDAGEKLLGVGDELSPQAQAIAHHAKGLALAKLTTQDETNAEQAIVELEQAVSLDPDAAEYAVDLAVAHIRAGRIDEGERLFRDLMARHTAPGPDASRVRVAYGQYLSQPGKKTFDEAMVVFAQAIDLAGDDVESAVESRLALAKFLTRRWALTRNDEQADPSAQEFFDQAESLLQECCTLEPDGLRAFVQLGTLYTADGRHEDAVDVCQQRLGRGFERKGLSVARKRINLFNLLILASQASMARGLKADGEGDEATRTQWLDKAQAYVTQARGEFPSHPKILSQSGRVKLARGQERAALEDLRQAHEAYLAMGTVDWQNLLLLAQLHVRLGEAGAAKDALEGILGTAQGIRQGDVPLWTVYGQAVFQTGDLDRALAVSEHVLLIDPGNENARQLKAAVLERKGRLSEAGALDAELTGSQSVRAILAARAKALDGNIEGALQTLRDALVEEPANVRLVWTTVGELLKLGRATEAAAVVEQALAEQPDDSALRKIAVYADATLSDEERARAMLPILEAEEDGYLRALGLADFHMRQRNWADALIQLSQAEQHLLSKDTPLARKATTRQHWELLAQKVRVATEAGDEKALTDARDAAAEYDVDGAGGASILGLYHALRKEFEPAIRAFREAVVAQPTDAQSLALLGHCLLNVGRTDDADVYFDRAVRINPQLVLAYRGRSTIARLRGDDEAYDRAYEAALKIAPDDPWVASETLIRRENADPKVAITRRESLLAKQPDDSDNLQRLALLCEQVGDLKKADDYFDRLLTINADDRQTVVTVGKYYRRTDRPARSLAVLTHFVDTRPDAQARAEAMVLVAGHYLSQKNLEKTETTLEEAVGLAETLETTRAMAEFYLRNTDRPASALPWLEKAIKLAEAADSPVASQLMAMRVACLLDRHVDDTDAARTCVAELRRRFPDDLRGLYWESEVLARVGDIEGAIESLSSYLESSPDQPQVLFQRARHYLALGKTSVAIADLERSVRSDPLALDLKPRLLLAAIHARAGRIDAAVRELEQVVRDAPQSDKATERLIRLYLTADRLDDAARVATVRINQGGDKPDPRWLQLRALAMMRRGDYDGTIADVQRAAELSGFTPDAVAIALDMYDQTSRFDEGIAFYDAHASSMPAKADVLSRYALLLAHAGKESESVVPFRKAMNLAIGDSVDALRQVTGHLQAAMPVDQAIELFAATPAGPGMKRGNDRIMIRLYRLAGRMEEAASILDQSVAAADTDRERAGLYQEAGDMDQVAGQYERAQEAYKRSLELVPDDWVTLNNLAYLLADGMGKYQEALPYAQRAVATMDNPDTLDTLGWIYVGLENYKLAIAELSRAARLDPSGIPVFQHLGEAYRRNGQFLEAADVFRRGLEVARAKDQQAAVSRLEHGLDLANARDDSARN